MSEIQSLARGLRALDILEAESEGIGVTGIARRIDVDKSTASRIMRTLANYGYAEQSSETRRYTLGPRLVRLGQSLLTRTPLRDQARPFLRELVERTQECAHLAVRASDLVLYLDQVESPASLRVSTVVGTLAPLHSTALGKVLLAFGNSSIPQELERYTPRTITDVETLRMHLEQTRRQGYAIDDEEFSYDVRCVAVPLYGLEGELVGAIGISGPGARLTLARIHDLAQEVQRVGQALTDRVSYRHEDQTAQQEEE